MINELLVDGSESAALDKRIAVAIGQGDRDKIWGSANRILDHFDAGKQTVLALGYVQSGKTTSITALCAAAADRGFQVVVAILGSTILLRNQNSQRLEQSLGLTENNYRWVSITEFNSRRTPKEIQNWIERGRVVLLPVLKNAKMISKVRGVLGSVALSGIRCLVIDDEADQASLNTAVHDSGESSTYAAIKSLRSEIPSHLFVQYTATPYAPLLLDPSDPIMPEAVEFLEPGSGYTGGKEFFIEHASEVVREIPITDEQSARVPLAELPDSLETALASYLVGAAHLYHQDKSAAPISMLIHSTFKNDFQERYHFLVDRLLNGYKSSDSLALGRFSTFIKKERDRLYQLGIPEIDEEQFWAALAFVLKETTLWLVNSASEVKKVQWNLAPFHILIGGNKLDRGFTVEGLTVTYMNRPPSEQIDTIEQRARAFGYRNNLLPYCQFFATARTIATLRAIVHTEDDLRANLRDALDSGKSIAEWARKIGLFIPSQTKPTRAAVVSSLSNFSPDGDWFALRKPLLDPVSVSANEEILKATGLLQAKVVGYQRLSHRTLKLPLSKLLSEVLLKWHVNKASPGWQHEPILEFLRRSPNQQQMCYLILMSSADGSNEPRLRKWVDDTGFVNLFQGEDISQDNPGMDYKGDRKVGLLQNGEAAIVLQIHHVRRRNFDEANLYTLAIHLGAGRLVKRGV
jgi:hypothetical protein